MEWKLTTLIENHEDTEEKYVCEHGFSILIEKLETTDSAIDGYRTKRGIF